MHEFSLCDTIRDVLETQALADGFAKVTKVWLEVGPLSCVEPEALRFGFDVVMFGSVAEGAALDIASPPARGRCSTCGEVSEVSQRFEACPACGMPGMKLTQGDEFRITKLEVI